MWWLVFELSRAVFSCRLRFQSKTHLETLGVITLDAAPALPYRGGWAGQR
jgi:hypothetical protein